MQTMYLFRCHNIDTIKKLWNIFALHKRSIILAPEDNLLYESNVLDIDYF